MRRYLFLPLFLLFAANFICNAQTKKAIIEDSVLDAPQYAVYFTDKNGTPYSVDNPLEFLSQRALDRRAMRGMAVNEDDLPVSPTYVAGLTATGAFVKWTSRWGNLAIVCATDNVIQQISELPYVDSIVYIKPSLKKIQSQNHNNSKWDNEFYHEYSGGHNRVDYGVASAQIEQINGVPVHNAGYRGEGILIAVIDAGFRNLNQIPEFQPLFESGRVVFEKDIVEIGGNIYSSSTHTHGTAVTSTMAVNNPGSFVGTAPDASYAFIRTEDGSTEYLVEEYNWIVGAEMADSLGADIINSSLGYSTFDDPEMQIPYSQMDGNTCISSIAVKRLTERGVHVVVSAGNSNGDEEWPWIGTPADAVEAMAIAAVDPQGNIASFSSLGPNGAGDPKPNVAACGLYCTVINANGTIEYSAGTSISSPITCGMVACLVQASPTTTPAEMMDIVQQHADRYPNTSIYYGYGIPDFGASLNDLDGISDNENLSFTRIYPNPSDDEINVSCQMQPISTIRILDITGRCINDISVNGNFAKISVKDIPSGIVFIEIRLADGKTETRKIIVR